MKKTKQLLDDVVIKSLVNRSNDYTGGVYFYAISDSGELYYIYLTSSNINDIKASKIETCGSVSNFISLSVKNYLDVDNNDVFVLTDDNKVCFVGSGILYNPNIVNVMGKYLVYENGFISNIMGEVILGPDGKNVKVKSIIGVIDEDSNFKYNPDILIITTDDEILYSLDEQTIYKYDKKVLKIEENNKKIIISFVDGTSVSFLGQYDLNIYPIS